MALTNKDLAAIRKVLYKAEVKGLTPGELKKLPEVKALSVESRAFVLSLTKSELAGLTSVYHKAKLAGATNVQLDFWAPIH